MTAPTGPRIRVVRDRGGLRLLEGDAVLSRVMARPGPTHMPFDVLAACVAALSPGRRALLLGFAGGGTVAALRAMGWRHPIDALDLSLEGHAHFREHSGPWSARSLASGLRAAVRAIGSREAARIAVRRLRRGAVRKPDRGPGSKGISASDHFR